jgi:hypothetical protein
MKLMSAITSFQVVPAVVAALSLGAPLAASAANPAPRPVSSILQASGPLGPDGPLGKNGPLHGGGCIGPNVNPTSLGPDGPLGPNGPFGPGGAEANKACAAVAPPKSEAAPANGAAPAKAAPAAASPAKHHAKAKRAHVKHGVRAKGKSGGHAKTRHATPRKSGAR